MTWSHDTIAIVNRGEPAMRLIHAVREYNREHGTSLRTLALYTEPDANALFVRQADRAVSLGPATSVDPADGERKSTYLRYDLLEKVLVDYQAGAAWVGWGFVAEHAAFADLCERLGVVFFQCRPFLLEPRCECLRALIQLAVQIAGAQESNCFDLAFVRPNRAVDTAEENMAKLIFGARFAKTRLVTKVINVFQCRCNVQLVIETPLCRDFERLAASGMTATTVRPEPRPQSFGRTALLQ